MMRKTVDIMVSCLIMSFILCTVIKPSISSAPQICAAESLLNNKIKKEKVAITSESSQSSQPLTQVKKLQRCRKRFRSANDDDDDWSDDSSSHYDEEIVIEKVQKNWGGVPKKFSCGMPNCQSMLYNKKSSYWHWRNMHGLTGDIFGCPDMTGVYYGCPVLECSTRYFGRFSLYKKHLCAHITKGDKIDKKYIFDECPRTPILPPDILEMVLKLKQQKKRENSVKRHCLVSSSQEQPVPALKPSAKTESVVVETIPVSVYIAQIIKYKDTAFLRSKYGKKYLAETI